MSQELSIKPALTHLFTLARTGKPAMRVRARDQLLDLCEAFDEKEGNPVGELSSHAEMLDQILKHKTPGGGCEEVFIIVLSGIADRLNEGFRRQSRMN